jgi:hypothetical protein
MPSSPNYKRDYKQEAKTAKKRGEQGTGSDAGSAQRHRARRKMLKEGKVKKGQDVHHKTPIKAGGTNSPKNLAATSPASNRSFPRNRKAGLRRA